MPVCRTSLSARTARCRRVGQRSAGGLAVLLLTLLAACSDSQPAGSPSDAGAAATGGSSGTASAGSGSTAPRDPAAGWIEQEPLPDRSAPAGDRRFARLHADRTGIDFVHEWTPDPQYLNVLGNAMAGGGVAVGDVDGDGLPDLLFTRPHAGSRLYRNLGDFHFEDVTAAAGILPDRWGGGASFADLDGDGDQDLYVCGYDEPNRLYVNQGDGTYLEQAQAAGLAFQGASVMMAFADHDRDGDLDGFLLTNRYAGRENPDRPPPTRNGQVYIPDDLLELFDLLADPTGRVMIVTAGQYDHLYRNDGGLRFTDITQESGITGNHFGLSATWWDYDADGWPDLYVANDFFGPDRLYRNTGDGRFVDVAATALPSTPWFSMGADTGDVDNDGRPDFFASDMAPTTHARRQVAMGDVRSGLWFIETSRPPQMVRNALYRNTGTGRFQEVSRLAGLEATNWTWSPVFGDLDGDGLLDLFVSNGMTRDYFNTDLLTRARVHGRNHMERFWIHQDALAEANFAFRNRGALEFEDVGDAWGLADVAASFGAALADLDRDGDLDIVANNYEAAPFVYRNESDDGHRLLVRLSATRSAPGGVGATVTIETPADDPARSRTGHQTRFVGLSRGDMAGHEPLVHFGLGDHARVESLRVAWPSGHVQRFVDLPADQLVTVVEPDAPPPAPAAPAASGAPAPSRPPGPVPASSRSGPATGPLPGSPTAPLFSVHGGPSAPEADHDDFRRQPLLPWKLSRLGPGLALGDVDADGDLDLVLGGPAGTPATLHLNDGAGHLVRSPQPALERDDAQEDMGVLLFDVDADGDLDLYVVSGGVESLPGSTSLRDRLYPNERTDDGAASFSPAPDGALPDLRDSGSVVAAADADRDGDLDLFVGGRSIPGRYPETPDSRLLRNDGGTFVDVTADWAPGLARTGLVTSALWTDVDGDGRIDLLIAREWDGLALWHGTSDGFVEASEQAGLLEHRGLWNGLAAGDVDADGDIDYVATNLGLNTPYAADRGEPMSLSYGDVDGSGVPHLVEAMFAGGVEVALASLESLRATVPFVGMGYPDHASYGMASLQEVFGAEVLARCLRREADTLASGVFLNDGAGRLAFRPLPRLAQVAPAFGVALVPIDGDGDLDLVLAQNFRGARPETGPLVGGMGLVLRGDGQGGFAPLEAADSGLIVPGDGRALASGDLDGDGRIDLVYGVSDEPLAVLLSAAPPPRALRVELRGPTGNRAAIGARVTLECERGATSTAEVAAGGGYLAQSSGPLLLGLGDGGAVQAVVVRWPDGVETRHEPDEGATVLRISRD